MSLREHYWRFLANCRNLATFIKDMLKPYYYPLQQRNNFGFFAVDIKARIGFFAQLSWCLYILDHCERLGLKPILLLSSPFYTLNEKDNWLDYFFLPQYSMDALKKDRRIKVSHISDIEQLGLPQNVPQMTLERGNYLINKYLPINDSVLSYVEEFVGENFGKDCTLGLHYRGTDKKLEAKPVEWDVALDKVFIYLNNNSQVDTLFVASDEQAFIKWLEVNLGHRVRVVYHKDHVLSENGHPIHTNLNSGCNYTKGKEALINCLLLSKCHALIRTSSFLSGWASVFNPSLPVIMLNRPYTNTTWFPDSLILQRAIDEYLPDKTKEIFES
ncbi:hypothetical protein NP603_07210 [Methylomonas sp. SURF-1]|uniref:Glycosyl transferase family 11 n=1 Tax=Methylomonas aurea TaxID=2952224 RepID=A0ABT1UHJ2_9GAMM|nr:hypothetical protein [Methylomonas sp. SURF-1]MCQ8180891.1 hypothetical protein [Methylomonas sp. SURF-1]